MFKPSLCRYSTRSDGIGHTSAENKYWAKKLILLRSKNKINPKTLKKSSSFLHALKKNLLVHLQIS